MESVPGILRNDKPVKVHCTKCGGIAGTLPAGMRPVLGSGGTAYSLHCPCGQEMKMRVSNG